VRERLCGTVRAHHPDRDHRPDADLRPAAPATGPGRIRGPLHRTATPIAAASSARPGRTTLPPTSLRSRSSVGSSSAASSTNTSGPHKAEVRTRGRVLEPHRRSRNGHPADPVRGRLRKADGADRPS
jgi:hypothetical protein